MSPSSHYGYNSSETPQNETPIKASHRLPIRFGLKIGYQLSERWALQTGITYTYLYSEFTLVNRQQPTIEQRLHYVGIPLGISYQIWKNSNFRLYATAGAAAEKCVKNSQKSEDSKINLQSDSEKPLQWSVNAALGAEYQPTKQLGIYLEPSLGYYFKDNTPLEHYYKEHPLSPSIEFGLRWHLNPR
jgi:opacity protein-like surface antigen